MQLRDIVVGRYSIAKGKNAQCETFAARSYLNYSTNCFLLICLPKMSEKVLDLNELSDSVSPLEDNDEEDMEAEMDKCIKGKTVKRLVASMLFMVK